MASNPTIPLLNEDTRLAALKRYNILDSFPEQGYDDITALASIICGTPISLVSLVDSDRQWFKSNHGLGSTENGTRETPRSQSFCAHTIPTASTLIVTDAAHDPRFAQNPLVLGDPSIRFYAGAPLIDPTGHVLGTVCVIDTKPRTLTPEQIAALEALARQVMALLELRLTIAINTKAAETLRTAEKLSAVGRLASVMAHEINNPLQSMANLLFMAQTSQEPEMTQAYIHQSQDQLNRVSHIVTQTLRFHRQSVKPIPTMLAEIVDSVLDLFRSRLGRGAVNVKQDNRQSQPILCHSGDLHQVISNLIGNAIDAVTGSPNATIQIRIRQASSVRPNSPHQQGIRLTIADNGSGMTTTTKTHLFEPFFTTKGDRGSGLGLWVSKGILDKHHATIQVHSTPKGTAFSIFLPTT